MSDPASKSHEMPDLEELGRKLDNLIEEAKQQLKWQPKETPAQQSEPLPAQQLDEHLTKWKTQIDALEDLVQQLESPPQSPKQSLDQQAVNSYIWVGHDGSFLPLDYSDQSSPQVDEQKIKILSDMLEMWKPQLSELKLLAAELKLGPKPPTAVLRQTVSSKNQAELSEDTAQRIEQIRQEIQRSEAKQIQPKKEAPPPLDTNKSLFGTFTSFIESVVNHIAPQPPAKTSLVSDAQQTISPLKPASTKPLPANDLPRPPPAAHLRNTSALQQPLESRIRIDVSAATLQVIADHLKTTPDKIQVWNRPENNSCILEMCTKDENDCFLNVEGGKTIKQVVAMNRNNPLLKDAEPSQKFPFKDGQIQVSAKRVNKR